MQFAVLALTTKCRRPGIGCFDPTKGGAADPPRTGSGVIVRRPAQWEEDFGHPKMPHCEETGPGTGLFVRHWTKTTVRWNCATGSGTVERIPNFKTDEILLRRSTREYALLLLLLGAAWPEPSAPTRNTARTPPMGFNTWNWFGCSVNASILTTTADLMVSTGLAAAGYEYVNSDDCWMAACRNPSLVHEPARSKCDGFQGPQLSNPAKFPGGVVPVVEYIHSKGLKFGLYTSASPETCAGFAASCHFEQLDAAQWARWRVDFMKQDACGGCRAQGKIADYAAMQSAIENTSRPFLLTVEGQPPFPAVADGKHGNARRVGHDITSQWLSMISLVDIGSNLHHFAHNDTGAGGWCESLSHPDLCVPMCCRWDSKKKCNFCRE
eukprot:SAG31_NODE_530_length_14420_cov_4.259968_11_plen_381_part_00